MKYDIRINRHRDSKRTKRLKACVMVPLSVVAIPLVALFAGIAAFANSAWSNVQGLAEVWEEIK